MKLIIGLGNPGKKYERTWHNLGFLALNNLQNDFGFSAFKKSAKFKAETASGEVDGEKTILAKPQTFMNLSGESVRAIADFYKIKPTDIIVIHDDLDLPLGKIRLAENSSAGGHNGIKSIIENLGGKNFKRIKIGIATDRLPTIDSADFVLMPWSKTQETAVTETTKKAAEAASDIIGVGMAKAMNKWN